jgi:hypothetical protein
MGWKSGHGFGALEVLGSRFLGWRRTLPAPSGRRPFQISSDRRGRFRRSVPSISDEGRPFRAGWEAKGGGYGASHAHCVA